MLPQATISHQTSHRIRVQIPRRKRNREYFAKLRDELSKLEGVERVEANPNTASVLIHHRSTMDKIIDYAQAAELFVVSMEEAPMSDNSLATHVVNGVVKLNQKLIAATDGVLDLTSVSALTLALGGVIKGIVWKDFFPSGGNMIWWAATLITRHDARMRGTAMASAPHAAATAPEAVGRTAPQRRIPRPRRPRR